MGSIERVSERATERARDAVRNAGRDIRVARRDRNLSQARVGEAAGLSTSAVSRIERGLSPDVSIRKVTFLAEAVGLEASFRLFAGGAPIRDRAHAALLARFRGRTHRDLRWATEVPLPNPGDARAWDALLQGRDWRYGVEAETAPRDVQALARRLTLKLRDGHVDGILLVLPRTRRVREFLEVGRPLLEPLLPVAGRVALASLRRGEDPGGGSIVVV
jgi:transcriptional regulator with XRE-family HTH domain